MRFVGRTESDFDVNEILELDDEGVPIFQGLDDADLHELCALTTAFGIKEISTVEELCDAITRRVTKELEPVIQVKHYVSRNKGKKDPGPFLQCGDPIAAVEAQEWSFDTKCVGCYEKIHGDKGISLSIMYTWSVYDTKKDHKVSSGGARGRRSDKDEKSEYEACTMAIKNRCQHCSNNNKLDDRPQDEITREELAALAKDGYSPVYTGGIKMLDLPETSYSLIEDLEMQARLLCRSCCTGKLQVSGASCPSCQEPFDFDELVGEGWDPDKKDRDKVKCGGCGTLGSPVCAYECSDCEDPVPARLVDVPVRARMTFEGKNDKRIWSFSIHGNPDPLELGRSKEVDAMLKQHLPDYDTILAPPEMSVQIKALGLTKNPITGEEVKEDRVSSAPTVGRAGLSASRGAAPRSSVKPGAAVVKRGSGFLNRG